MLSRGKGVPSQTREAYERIRRLLEERRETLTGLQVQRIGLEGETRLCAGFRSDAEAQAALDQIRSIASGVELLDIATSPCPTSKEKTP